MRKFNGFTLIELLIVVAIIAILAMVAWGAVGPRKAGAAEAVYPLYQALNEWNVQYSYSSSGTLVVFNKGETTWESAAVACTELKALDPNLRTVILTHGEEADDSAQLGWDKDHTELTNLNGRSEANCT